MRALVEAAVRRRPSMNRLQLGHSELITTVTAAAPLLSMPCARKCSLSPQRGQKKCARTKTMIAWLCAVLVLVMALLAWASARRAAAVPAPYESYSPHVGVDRTYRAPVPPPGAETPLARAVRLAVDGPPPKKDAKRETAAYTLDEMQWLMRVVARRVNAQDPALGLHALSISGANKWGTALGNSWYEADVDVHSTVRTVSAKLVVRASLSKGGTLRIHGLKIHGAQDPRTVAGLAAFQESPGYVDFAPAAVYPARAATPAY